MLKFDKEITKLQIVKYVTMNYSCEFLTTNNKFYVILK